jgi:hypothetical protein
MRYTRPIGRFLLVWRYDEAYAATVTPSLESSYITSDLLQVRTSRLEEDC